jgi:hypothetical protein
VDVTLKFQVPTELKHAFMALTDEESSKLLAEVGRHLVEREKIFQRHFEQGQSKWAQGSERYNKWKKKKYGSTEKFVKTGKAKANLTHAGDAMLVRVSKSKRMLSISLKNVQDGVNVYSVAQKGQFRGLDTKEHGELSAKDVFAGKAKGSKGATRISSGSREITVTMPEDNAVVAKVLEEEINKTMKLRGF